MAVGSKLYAWQDVAEVPQGTGIYAWYYRHLLTDYDIEQFKERLSGLDVLGKKALSEEFLLEHLFQPLAEEPYQVSMTGPLKPEYGGELQCRLGGVGHPRGANRRRSCSSERAQDDSR